MCKHALVNPRTQGTKVVTRTWQEQRTESKANTREFKTLNKQSHPLWLAGTSYLTLPVYVYI